MKFREMPKTTNYCFFLCQKICVYVKITDLICLKIDSVYVQKSLASDHSLLQSVLKGFEIKQSKSS